MKSLTGAVVVLAGAVLVGCGVLAESLYLLSSRPNAPLPAVVQITEIAGLVLCVGGVVGIFSAQQGDRREPDEPEVK